MLIIYVLKQIYYLFFYFHYCYVNNTLLKCTTNSLYSTKSKFHLKFSNQKHLNTYAQQYRTFTIFCYFIFRIFLLSIFIGDTSLPFNLFANIYIMFYKLNHLILSLKYFSINSFF